jgi:indolepyruvate ferredoxin oxidoreductase beta subunit
MKIDNISSGKKGEKLKLSVKNIYEINVEKIAAELGNSVVQNVVLLRIVAAIGGFPVERKYIIESIKENFSPKFIDSNIKAFENGCESLSLCKVY